jgi:hypothetical protein
MVSLVVGPYFDMPPLLLPGLEPATPGTPTVLTRVRCLSLKPDMGSTQLSRLQNKRQGAVMRIRFEQSFEAHETILNSDMSVAYITDCDTSPVKILFIFYQ